MSDPVGRRHAASIRALRVRSAARTRLARAPGRPWREPPDAEVRQVDVGHAPQQAARRICPAGAGR
eukprot:8722263-Pyramimonas_sp.AAC.1